MRLARALGAVGRVGITSGPLILLFVAYQLWGTGLREAQAQDRLADQLAEVVGEAETNPVPPPTSGAGAPETALPVAAPVEGNPIARIRMPKIGVDKIVVERVSLTDLEQAPGHFPGTPPAGAGGQRRHRGSPQHLRGPVQPDR